MSRIGVFFAEGYEEIEALTVVDVARRAQIEVCMISVEEMEAVKGSHGIAVWMDGKLSETDFAGLDIFAVWSPAQDAPFVALEPWNGSGTQVSEDDVFEHKQCLRRLAPGQEDTVSFTVTVF